MMIAALALLTGNRPQPAGDGPAAGKLQRGRQWEISVDARDAPGPTAFTVYYLGERRQLDLTNLTVPRAAIMSLPLPKPGRGVKRVVIEVSPPAGSLVCLEIRQGTLSHPHGFFGNHRIVMDVE
jgi:hypothetical protein